MIDKNIIIDKSSEIFAENAGIEVTESLKSILGEVIGLLENKNAWIQSSRQSGVKSHWIICETKNGKVLTEPDGRLSLGLAIKKKAPYEKNLVDFFFGIKRGESYQEVLNKLEKSPLKLN